MTDGDPRFRRLARLAAAAVVLVGLLTLTGWIFGVERLKSFAPPLGQMKGNAALAFIALGAAAWLHIGRRRPTAAVLAALAGALGLATLIEYAAGVHIGIDQLLFSDHQSVGSVSAPGRIGVETAVGVLVGGAAIVLWTVRPTNVLWIETGALAIGALGLLAVIG